MLVCFLKKNNLHLKQPSAFEFRMFEYSNVIIKLFPKPEISITAHESSSNTACGVLHYSSSVRSVQTQFTKKTLIEKRFIGPVRKGGESALNREWINFYLPAAAAEPICMKTIGKNKTEGMCERFA